MMAPGNFASSLLLVCTLHLARTAAFSTSFVQPAQYKRIQTKCNAVNENGETTTSRRTLFQHGVMSALSLALGTTTSVAPASAAEGSMPMLSTDEFLIVLRDSAKAIQRVEFSGPKAETVIVRLVDGTSFGIKDVIESPTDPRSPLKVQAACREAKVPFKNLQIEAILATAPKKTKVYTNLRVQEAAAKEKERLERIANDEQDRLAALYKLEQEEDAGRGASAAN